MNDILTRTAHLTTHLGPAKVVTVEGHRVLVALGEAKAWATLAMPVYYAPAVGDTLLVLGREEVFYAIGVIAGRGRTSLVAPGDLELLAPHGRIDLHARDGIELRTSALRCVADAWDAVFGTVRQRCSEFLCHVRGVLRWRAQRSETSVEQVHRTRAGSIVQHAEGEVQIDGRKINLG
jgi:hypothetical protein